MRDGWIRSGVVVQDRSEGLVLEEGERVLGEG